MTQTRPPVPPPEEGERPPIANAAVDLPFINIFWSLAQARVVISDWKEDYNQHRRHSTLPPAPTDDDSHHEWISPRGPARPDSLRC